MNLKKIENKALELSQSERPELAQKLLISLETPSSSEVEAAWIVEAQRRTKEIDDAAVQLVSAEAVREKTLALLSLTRFS